MTEGAVAAIALVLFGWAIVSGVLSERNITGPLLFTVVGFVLGNPDWGPLTIDVSESSVHLLAEFTLALVLFGDAARVNVKALRRDVSVPVRLLAIGLPLSIVAGALLAGWLVTDIPWALAGFLGAALAPTDAALSVQVIDDKQIPMPMRRALNVESGLNDGLATPVVTVMLAIAASELGVAAHGASYEAGSALRDLAAGLLVGVVGGASGAVLLTLATRRGWCGLGNRRLASLAVAVGAFTVALAIDGNGFIAAFVAGVAFGAAVDHVVVDIRRTNELVDLGGELLALVVWFVFGATVVPVAFDHGDARMILYALLSLTVVRMAPVALSLIGSGLDRPSVLFIAWFGPRGLASVVFALLAIEELGQASDVADRTVAAVTFTVLASVVLHGITARPGGRRYVQREHLDAETVPHARPQALHRRKD